MSVLNRFSKQIFIATIFFAVVFGVSMWIWSVTRPQPTCFDGILNQNEEATDCGGICSLACKKLPVYPTVLASDTRLFPVLENTYNVYGEVENRNLDFGARYFRYTFDILDASGTIVAARSGESYLTPGEKKALVEQKIETKPGAASVRLTVSDERWIEISVLPRADFGLRDKVFELTGDRGAPDGSRVSGVLTNHTGLDFEKIDIVAVLRDDMGEMLGVGNTDVRTLRDGEQRAFEIRWPLVFERDVSRVDVETYTNVLANENFLVRYGKNRQRFQEEVPIPKR